jgi:hypothetical protein
MSILAAAVVLALPAAAMARQTNVIGTVTGDTTQVPFSFGAFGKKVKKGLLVATKVGSFTGGADVHCFNPTGNQISSTTYNQLPIAALGTLKLRKGGAFQGHAVSGPWDITLSGVLRKGKANGLLAVQQGTKGSPGFCSTGTFNDAAVPWSAREVPLVCTGASLTARPLCATPRP